MLMLNIFNALKNDNIDLDFPAPPSSPLLGTKQPLPGPIPPVPMIGQPPAPKSQENWNVRFPGVWDFSLGHRDPSP